MNDSPRSLSLALFWSHGPRSIHTHTHTLTHILILFTFRTYGTVIYRLLPFFSWSMIVLQVAALLHSHDVIFTCCCHCFVFFFFLPNTISLPLFIWGLFSLHRCELHYAVGHFYFTLAALIYLIVEVLLRLFNKSCKNTVQFVVRGCVCVWKILDGDCRGVHVCVRDPRWWFSFGLSALGCWWIRFDGRFSKHGR